MRYPRDLSNELSLDFLRAPAYSSTRGWSVSEEAEVSKGTVLAARGVFPYTLLG